MGSPPAVLPFTTMKSLHSVTSPRRHAHTRHYLVVLDPDSVTTRCFSNRGPDGRWHGHPCMVGHGVDASNPRYLVLRQTVHGCGSNHDQHMHVPHQAVAYIVECESDEALQAGFKSTR